MRLLMDKTKLYQRAMELARQADFQFWDGETWAPKLQAIDWSCDYDDQVVELVRLTVKTCANLADNTNSRLLILESFGLAQKYTVD